MPTFKNVEFLRSVGFLHQAAFEKERNWKRKAKSHLSTFRKRLFFEIFSR